MDVVGRGQAASRKAPVVVNTAHRKVCKFRSATFLLTCLTLIQTAGASRERTKSKKKQKQSDEPRSHPKRWKTLPQLWENRENQKLQNFFTPPQWRRFPKSKQDEMFYFGQFNCMTEKIVEFSCTFRQFNEKRGWKVRITRVRKAFWLTLTLAGEAQRLWRPVIHLIMEPK